MARYRQIAASLIFAFAAWLHVTHAQAANCVPSNITLFSATPLNFGVYSPYSPAPVVATFIVTVATNANCTNLFFALSATGGTFAPTASSLAYQVIANPPTFNAPRKINVNATTVTLAFTARINAGQLAPGGVHTTALAPPIRLNLYLREHGDLIVPAARSIPLDTSVNVLTGCQLPAPSLSNVDFTAALTTGVPNPAIVRTVTFAGASCVAPARIRLSGSALQPAAPMLARPGFDTTINWHALATFGLATANLNTSGTTQTQVTSTSKNANGTAATTGNINVNINLLPNARPQAGSYSGTLTVTIDPFL